VRQSATYDAAMRRLSAFAARGHCRIRARHKSATAATLHEAFTLAKNQAMRAG
jgi:hypothetical protein